MDDFCTQFQSILRSWSRESKGLLVVILLTDRVSRVYMSKVKRLIGFQYAAFVFYVPVDYGGRSV